MEMFKKLYNLSNQGMQYNHRPSLAALHCHNIHSWSLKLRLCTEIPFMIKHLKEVAHLLSLPSMFLLLEHLKATLTLLINTLLQTTIITNMCLITKYSQKAIVYYSRLCLTMA
jgi:hypothetical protein